MSKFLIYAFLFFIGSTFGWLLEVVFRKFFSKNNPKHIWVNPGFLIGPYLPLYGSGLVVLFIVSNLQITSLILKVVLMGALMTLIEYIVGIYCLKVNNERYWDYSKEWGNIEGVICPKFTLAWTILCVIYYFLIHPYIIDAIIWLSNNLAFSFVIGMFYGVFLIDVSHSLELNKKFKQFAKENDIVVQLDLLKMEIKERHDKLNLKHHFFNPLKSEISINEHLKNIKDRAERIKHKVNGR